MKTKTHEAARQLDLHPADLVCRVSELVGSLEDCWPDIDSGFIETLRELQRELPRPPQEDESEAEELSIGRDTSGPSPLESAQNRVLDKLSRQDKWGGNAVSWDTLRKHYCRGVESLRDAVDALLELELLSPVQSRSGPYSLNPARKGEIDRRVEKFRSQGC